LARFALNKTRLWSRFCLGFALLAIILATTAPFAEGGEDVATYCHLSQLEGDLAGMSRDPRPDLDETVLDACQRSIVPAAELDKVLPMAHLLTRTSASRRNVAAFFGE
jgi:hypothetical protein